MIKLTIIDTTVTDFKGVGKASGKPFHMHKQTAYAHCFGKDGKPLPYPEKIELILDTDSNNLPKPYAAGDYQLHPASLYVGKYGLEVAPKLVPLKA